MTNTASEGMQAELRVLLFQDRETWVAQALEVNLVAQAKELRDLLYEFDRVLRGRLLWASQLGVAPFAGIKKAPKKYRDMYESAALSATLIDPRPFEVSDEQPKPRLQLRMAA